MDRSMVIATETIIIMCKINGDAYYTRGINETISKPRRRLSLTMIENFLKCILSRFFDNMTDLFILLRRLRKRASLRNRAYSRLN